MQSMIDLRLNYPLLEGQAAGFKTLLQSVLDGWNPSLSVTAAGGNKKDREIAAAWLSDAGYTVHPENVFIGGGGHHCCLVAMLAAGWTNRTIAVEEFTYGNFKAIASMLGITLVPCRMDEEGLLPASLREQCTARKVDGLYIMPTVNNPLGTVLPLQRRHEVVEIARHFNLTILEDDAYGFLEPSPPPSFFQLAPERSFYVYSLSKPLGQGIKTSFLLAPVHYADKILEVLRLTGTNPSPLFAGVLNNMIENGLLQKIIEEKQEEGRIRQLGARALLNDYVVTGHPNGWHLWLTLPPAMRADELEKKLLAAGVTIVSAPAFSAAEPAYNQGIRIALGGEADFNRVKKGIGIICEQIAAF